MTEIPDNAYACFDYVVNTRKTYDLLGEALALLQRRAKRGRHTVEEELRGATTRNLAYGSPLFSHWLRRAREAVAEAAKDFRQFFEEELPDNTWIDRVDPRDVLRVALLHEDWWRT